mgnify:CR=1 FL=1|tara:strand:- start:410 stop:1180 length:771 start_codon:yes stop_codon:yes gene_type:complete
MERNLIQLPESFLNNPIAHRGLHDCGDLMGIGNGPENSRESIMHAIKLGFGVEIDVRFSKDFIPIVVHDQNLLRLCQVDINVSKGNYRDFLQGRLKNKELLPTLDDILRLIQGRVPVLIEIKSEVEDRKEELIATLIRDHVKDYSGPLALMSFNWGIIKALESLNLKIPKGLVSQAFNKVKRVFTCDSNSLEIEEKSLVKNGVSFISHEYQNLSKDFYRRNVRANRKVLTWTVCNKEMAVKARDKCDNITFEGFLP